MKRKYLVLNVGGHEEGVEADYCLIPVERLPQILAMMQKVAEVVKLFDNEKSTRVVLIDHVEMVKSRLMDFADENVPQGTGEFMEFYDGDIEANRVDAGMTYLELSVDDFWYSTGATLSTESLMVSRKELEEFIAESAN